MARRDRPGFEALVKRMPSRDAVEAEDGFQVLKGRAAEFTDELWADYEAEESAGVRGWLMELLVATKSPRLLPFFRSLLDDEDDLLRDAGIAGLIGIDDHDSRKTLWEAGYDPKVNPWEQVFTVWPPDDPRLQRKPRRRPKQ